MAALLTSASPSCCIASSPSGAGVYSSVGSSPKTVYFARAQTQTTRGRWKLVTASSGRSGGHEGKQSSDDFTEKTHEEKQSSDDIVEKRVGRSFLSATTAAALSICILGGVEIEFATAARPSRMNSWITQDVTNMVEKTGNSFAQNYPETPGPAVKTIES